VSPSFSLGKDFFAAARLPLASLASDFKIRKICQQKNDLKPKFGDPNKQEPPKRRLVIFISRVNKLKAKSNSRF